MTVYIWLEINKNTDESKYEGEFKDYILQTI